MEVNDTHWPVPAIQVREQTWQQIHQKEYQQAHGQEHKQVLAQLNVERILRLRFSPGHGGAWIAATVCGCHGLRDITWWAETGSGLFKAGQLISSLDLNGFSKPTGRGVDDKTEVVSVVQLDQVDPDINLLETVPNSWLPVVNEGDGIDWVEWFQAFWVNLSRPMRAWFNAVFWHHPRRLHGFMTAPASVKHHHARPHGLFVHSVDCTWRALQCSQADGLVDTDVLVMATLLHDVGKASEYERNHRTQNWRLTDRGALIGHRLTALEWMAAARGVVSREHAPNEQSVLAVYHAINASPAPDWVGLRCPRTLEAFYLASVDSLSGHCDLIRTHALLGRSQGRYHAAFRGGAFVSTSSARGTR